MDDELGTNNQLVLVVGESSAGKSASLRNIRDQKQWLYLSSESGKRLPFKNNFMTINMTDPYQVWEYFDVVIAEPECKGAILDSMTFAMDMFETQYVLSAANTMKAWGDFAQYFKTIMQSKVPQFARPTIIMAHTKSVLDEKAMEYKTAVPIKGSLANNGVEAYFSTVVSAKKVSIKELESYGSKLLTITDEERELGYKHVFQTRLTKNTVGERIRSPMGMFDKSETYMDNDCQLLLDHLDSFYRN